MNIEELTKHDESSWPMIIDWLSKARNGVEILAPRRDKGEAILLGLQVSTRSPMGAIAFNSGGILFDHGWLRFLGSGNDKMNGSLSDWNNLYVSYITDYIDNLLIVAHDVIGGFFGINGGAFSGNLKKVYYFAPDTLTWENLGLGYSDLLYWAAYGDLEKFYKTYRWIGWETEVGHLDGDHGFNIWPPPWAHEGGPIAQRSRRIVPQTQLWEIQRYIEQSLKS